MSRFRIVDFSVSLVRPFHKHANIVDINNGLVTRACDAMEPTS